jgi:tetratricopeptide (TPR) repeat protein
MPIIQRNLAYWKTQRAINNKLNFYQAILAGLNSDKTFKAASRLLANSLDYIEVQHDQYLWISNLDELPETINLLILKAHLLISIDLLPLAQKVIEIIYRDTDGNNGFESQIHLLIARYLSASKLYPGAISILRLLYENQASSPQNAYILNLLAVNQFVSGGYQKSVESIRLARNTYETLQDLRSLGFACQNEAIILNAIGRYRAAINAINKTIHIFQGGQTNGFLIDALLTKHWILIAQGQGGKIDKQLQRLTRIVDKSYPDIPAPLQWKLYRLFEYLGQPLPFYFPYRNKPPKRYSWVLIEDQLIL